MGIGFVLVGLVLIISGARDTYAALGSQLRNDLTGPGNFTFWIAAIAAVGALGYIPALKSFSHWFLALVLLALLLTKSHANFFSQFSAALAAGPASAPTANNAAVPQASPGSLPGLPNQAPGQSLQDYLTKPPSFSFNPPAWMKNFSDTVFGPNWFKATP